MNRTRTAPVARRTTSPVNRLESPCVAAPQSDVANREEIEEWASPLAGRQRAQRANEARNSNGRRRNIDPTTCDRDYSTAEMEFMAAMQEYKQSSGRMFPTWSEVLEVLQALGYRKVACQA